MKLALTTILATFGLSTISQASILTFECALKSDASTGIRVFVNGKDFNSSSPSPVIARFELIKGGVVVDSATNAIIDQRAPVTQMGDGVIWAMHAKLGRSGSFAMGYDVMNDSFSMNADTMRLRIDLPMHLTQVNYGLGFEFTAASTIL